MTQPKKDEELLQTALNLFRLGFTNEIVGCALVTHENVGLKKAMQLAEMAGVQWLGILHQNAPLPPLPERLAKELLLMVQHPIPKPKPGIVPTVTDSDLIEA